MLRHHHSTIAVTYIGLGSNIDSEANLKQAAEKLIRHFPSTEFSSVYRTAPQEVEDQPDFLNAVAKIETDLPPEKLHNALKEIEKSLGKDPPHRFGPRTIDLDILLYDNIILPSPEEHHHYNLQPTTYNLFIPHPRMHQRRFVLAPLCELIDPGSFHPVLNESWSNLLESVQNQKCTKVDCQLRKVSVQ